ncbi:MAG: hypothetical protein SFX73_21795 [Kofleriaceae bacterium]|nr:hypothetical protein [Kofleriaceae bacterium]
MNAKDFIATQIAAIQRGDLTAVRAGLTERHRDKVTAELLAKAQLELQSITLDELVGSTVDVDDGVKVMMKNERTLTTLVPSGDVWLADTLWFK